MRALVPVSVRMQSEQGAGGNRLAVMRGPLPVYIGDPLARLRFVRRAMDGLKDSKQAVGAATLAAVNNMAPPTILAQASRLNFSTRLFNLIVTNIPGPQMPLYVLGRQLEDLFPIAFLPKNHALAVAIMSYNGRLEYGLLADYDALPDLDVIAEGIDSSLDELLDVARGRPHRDSRSEVPERGNGGNGRDPVTILPSSGPRSKSGPAADMRAKRNRVRSSSKRPRR
jgi:diacylglycerol O-acyltransferase / wax synthase